MRDRFTLDLPAARPNVFRYYLVAGFGLTIWYNWETIKRLKGQRNNLNRVNYIIGILVILFGVFLILGAMAMIKVGFKDNSDRAEVSLGFVYISFGIATIALTLKTIRYHRVT